MATTTNFGWETPDDTDLVKDGAAAIRTALGGVDTSFVDLKGGTTNQVLAKNSNTDLDFKWVSDATGMTNPMTTTGDTIYSSSGSTPARLGIGSTGQVLTVSGGVPVWAAAASFNPNYTLLNTGGTALTGDTTVTISGISGKSSLFIYVTGASSANSGSVIAVRLNGDSSGYVSLGGAAYSDSSNFFTPDTASTTAINIARLGGNSAANTCSGMLFVQGTNATGLKPWVVNGNSSGSSDARSYAMQGYYTGNSAITSVSVTSSTGNLDAGTVYVYGA